LAFEEFWAVALMKSPKGRPIRREKNATEIKCFDFMSYSFEQPGWETAAQAALRNGPRGDRSLDGRETFCSITPF
jgi:hypothetical protein